MTSPNWPAINRAISESIEPKTSEYPVEWNRKDPIAWRWVDGIWFPRDWREPAAAMELLRRLIDKVPLGMRRWSNDKYELFLDADIRYGRSSSFNHMLGDTIEEAIVLAYYATLKDSR